MMWLVALIQTSLLVQPMYLGDAPPELRSLRGIRLVHTGVADRPAEIVRSKEDALELAADLVRRLRHGMPFDAVAAQHAPAAERERGCVVGSFTQGALSPAFDEFLFSAEEGAVSAPIATDSGVHILQRISTRAAVRQIMFRGDDAAARARCESALAKLREGAEFAALARELSEDRASAERGGQFAIYERSARDVLLKAAAFELDVGEVAGPIHSPLGWHLLKRVPITDVDSALAESNFVRVRAILIQTEKSIGADPATAPTELQAKAIADRVYLRLQAKEDMRVLALEFDQDVGGKEREGDLGWLHRYAPTLPDALKKTFLMRPGETSEPFPTPVGYLIVRRER